jgi:hypothetical protein
VTLKRTPLSPGRFRTAPAAGDGVLRFSTFPARVVPLGRGAGLGTSPGPGRRTRIRPGRRAVGAATGQPKPPGEFTPAVKLQIRTRAGAGDPFDAQCECCAGHLGRGGGEIQHIVARGSGGCRDTVVNGPAGGALLCGSAAAQTGCHGRAEKRDPQMKALGFVLPFGTDPRLVPMQLYGWSSGGVTVWRAEDGRGADGTGYLYSPPGLEAAS